MKRVIFFIFAFIFIIQFSQAYVGLSPPRYYLTFEPNTQHIFTFNFITDEPKELEVYVDGDLKEYATLSTTRIQGDESVNVLLELPDKVSTPGEHVIYIGARQISDGSNSISVSAEVRGTIRVFVPYPGKYAITRFYSSDSKVGVPINFSLFLDNQGMESIEASGKIEIFDEKGKVLEELPVSSWILDSKQYDTRYYNSLNSSFKQGKYTAKSTINYEGGTLKENSTFRVGDLAVTINQYTKYLVKDKLNKFEVEVESLWNDPIENIYVNVSILDYPISFSTTSANFEGFQALNLSGYFDTSIIQEDTIRAKITVHYAKKTTEKTVKLRFKGTVDYGLVALIAGLALALVIIIFLVLWIRKLENSKNGKTKKSKK